MNKKKAEGRRSVIYRVVQGNQYVCSICGKQMTTTTGYSGLRCVDGHKIGEFVDEHRVTAHQREGKHG